MEIRMMNVVRFTDGSSQRKLSLSTKLPQTLLLRAPCGLRSSSELLLNKVETGQGSLSSSDSETIGAALMARIGSSSLVFPPFRGFTRRLVLANLAVFFVLLVLGAVNRSLSDLIFGLLVLTPRAVAHGYVWQLVTYAFVHRGILEALFNLLSIWFIASYLEETKGSRWLMEIYFLAVVGGALIATALSFAP